VLVGEGRRGLGRSIAWNLLVAFELGFGDTTILIIRMFPDHGHALGSG